jgi:hypothetical protein
VAGGGPRLAAALALPLLALGCGDGRTPAPSTDGHQPPLCAKLDARITGRVSTSAAAELSGLVLSRSHPGVLWTHNDSGDAPRLLAIAADGRPLGELEMTGAHNVDWEDIAAADGALYVGDIGDNLARRPTVTVYRVPDRSLTGVVQARRLRLRYPDRPHDAEALLADTSSNALVVVTKSLGRTAAVYVADHPSPGTTTTMRRAGQVTLGNAIAVTAGDVSVDGRTVVLRSYDRAFVWRRHRGEPLVAALRRRSCTAGADLLTEGQGEALALTHDGCGFYTVPEGRNPALRRYAPAGR